MPIGAGTLVPVLARPLLLAEALRTVWSHRRRGWWSVLVPLPSAEHLAWRTLTAYGVPDALLSGPDLLAFLSWRRRQRRVR